MKAGIDFGTTLTKAVWKKDDKYVFASTKEKSLQKIIDEMKKDGVDKVQVEGVKYTQKYANELWDNLFMVRRSNSDPIISEINCQAVGARELLLFEGKSIDEFLLVGMGTGTSYSFVINNVTSHYPIGNSIGGGFMRGLAHLFGVHRYSELVSRAERGNLLDLRVKDVLAEKKDVFEGELVIANFGRANAGDCLSDFLDKASGRERNKLNDVCATIVHCVAVATIRDVMLSSLTVDENQAVPEDVIYVGSTIAYNPVLQKMLNGYSYAIGKTPHFPANGAFALAMGAYLKADDCVQKAEHD
ncbi:hypothetical protein HY485_03095 [Candidatus Woesearchaeota archaeon]|nr:hypothetical protein [Candidatus Woesearchaeota archaeon]